MLLIRWCSLWPSASIFNGLPKSYLCGNQTPCGSILSLFCFIKGLLSPKFKTNAHFQQARSAEADWSVLHAQALWYLSLRWSWMEFHGWCWKHYKTTSAKTNHLNYFSVKEINTVHSMHCGLLWGHSFCKWSLLWTCEDALIDLLVTWGSRTRIEHHSDMLSPFKEPVCKI